jgi:hypothetical protein
VARAGQRRIDCVSGRLRWVATLLKSLKPLAARNMQNGKYRTVWAQEET